MKRNTNTSQFEKLSGRGRKKVSTNVGRKKENEKTKAVDENWNTVFDFLWRIFFRFYDYEKGNGDNHVSKTEKTLFCFKNFQEPIEEKNQESTF